MPEIDRERYNRYIDYHNSGDCRTEAVILKNIGTQWDLSQWQRFQLSYLYSATYCIDSAIKIYLNRNAPKKTIRFRTDRRFVRNGDNYERLLQGLDRNKYENLIRIKTTKQAYELVGSWFFFGRYSAFLFLETYFLTNNPSWEDNLIFGWEKGENYNNGAELLFAQSGADEQQKNILLESIKNDTGDICFAIETSLCAWAKFYKGTRWPGYYTERAVKEAMQSEY